LGKFEIAFAVGAIASAGVVAGILYALYPNDFGGTAPSDGATSTASNAYTGVDGLSSTASENGTASQNATSTAGNVSSQQPSSTPGY
jgi:hypothetical protein